MKRGKIPKEDLYPNSTQFPNILLDEVWTFLMPSEAMVLAVAVRRTLGWQKREDMISLVQFCEGTGLSRRTVQKALHSLKAVNLMIDLGWQPDGKKYTLNIWYDLDYGPINLEMLRSRRDERERAAQKQTKKARDKAGSSRKRERMLNSLKDVEQPSQNLIKHKKPKCGEKRHHQNLMALYREAIREDEGKKDGKELTAVGKENKAGQKILQMGFTPEEAIECYRHFKKDMFWRDKHLSLAYIAEHIGAWKEAKGEANRRLPGKPGVSQAQRAYYSSHLDPKD